MVSSPDGADFRVMAPVSVRAPGQAGTLGNHVAMWLASMPIHEPDPIARFDAVHAETEKLKQTDQALGAATLVQAQRRGADDAGGVGQPAGGGGASVQHDGDQRARSPVPGVPARR